MTETLAGPGRMAGRKKESFDRGRVEFKADPEWIERATRAAEALGFGSLSALVRVAVTAYLAQHLPEAPPAQRKRRKGKSPE